MLTLSTLWILLVSNQYIYNIFILMLLTVVSQNILSLQTLNTTKLLFNSYIGYDIITISIIIIGSLVAIWLISLIIPNFKIFTFNNELLTLIILLVIAMGSLAGTNSYLTLFVAIELQSLTLYILLANNLTKFNSSPLPTTHSAVVGKGASALDVSRGELNKSRDLITNKLSKVSLSYLINAATATALLLLGFTIQNNLLILIAILWKLGVMPLHAWSLPILDNQHSLVVSIYLTITKYGTLLVIGLIASQSVITISILTYIGLLNLTVGNVLGLLQYRYQRIIVYSSLIQIGYMLLILGNYSSLGISYFELYSFFTIMLLMLWIVPNYNKLNANNLLPSVQLWTLVLTLYTVAGLPFFPLFWTKLDVLLTIQSESLTIALISTLLSSLIYVRLIKYMSFF